MDGQGPTDSCYDREDIDGSNIVALVLRDNAGIAYMSYDYNFPGAAPGDPTLYCGDNGGDHNIVTEEEAAFCALVLSVAVQDGKNAMTNFLILTTLLGYSKKNLSKSTRLYLRDIVRGFKIQQDFAIQF